MDAATPVSYPPWPGNETEAYGGDGGPATSAFLNYPLDVAVDAAGNVFIADYVNHRVRRGDVRYRRDRHRQGHRGGRLWRGRRPGGSCPAPPSYPNNTRVDAAGNLFIGDAANVRVRKVAAGVVR